MLLSSVQRVLFFYVVPYILISSFRHLRAGKLGVDCNASIPSQMVYQLYNAIIYTYSCSFVCVRAAVLEERGLEPSPGVHAVVHHDRLRHLPDCDQQILLWRPCGLPCTQPRDQLLQPVKPRRVHAHGRGQGGPGTSHSCSQPFFTSVG